MYGILTDKSSRCNLPSLTSCRYSDAQCRSQHLQGPEDRLRSEVRHLLRRPQRSCCLRLGSYGGRQHYTRTETFRHHNYRNGLLYRLLPGNLCLVDRKTIWFLTIIQFYYLIDFYKTARVQHYYDIINIFYIFIWNFLISSKFLYQ